MSTFELSPSTIEIWINKERQNLVMQYISHLTLMNEIDFAHRINRWLNMNEHVPYCKDYGLTDERGMQIYHDLRDIDD